MVSSIERFHCIQDSQLGPVVSSIERFHCIQDRQLGLDGIHYREVSLYNSVGPQYTVVVIHSNGCITHGSGCTIVMMYVENWVWI